MLSQAPVSVGQTISKGQIIGYVGCTGICEGEHVHFMLYDESYERKGGSLGTGIGYGGDSKVYDPERWIKF
jgi:murein DD-endopeptidase MepM/ murein hydrolase activator NlpD